MRISKGKKVAPGSNSRATTVTDFHPGGGIDHDKIYRELLIKANMTSEVARFVDSPIYKKVFREYALECLQAQFDKFLNQKLTTDEMYGIKHSMNSILNFFRAMGITINTQELTANKIKTIEKTYYSDDTE